MAMASSEDVEGNCLGWAAKDTTGVLSPFRFYRRTPRDDDVQIKILYCGVCHADLSWSRNFKVSPHYPSPLVPGHEIVGVVQHVGPSVTKFKVGDYAGVGNYVDSCKECDFCSASREILCEKGPVLTYYSLDSDGSITKGGYSGHIVVHERYCYTIPEGHPLEKFAPLLCAGITVYTPMVRHNMRHPGKSLGVIGLGGLGHIAVKLGKAFGLKVTVLSRNEDKREEAINLLKADHFIVTSDDQQMKSAAKSLDFIIDTASGKHPFDPYLALLKVEGVIVLVGAPLEVHEFSPVKLLHGVKSITGSVSGGTTDTQEMINFCAANNVFPEIELISMDYINKALDRLAKGDVKYRFVVDIGNTLK